MATVYWKIEHEPWKETTGGWDTSNKTTITDFYDPILSLSLGDGRDTFSMKVRNVDGNNNVKYNPRDKLYVYRKFNDNTFTSNDLLMIVLIDIPKEQYTTNSQFLTISGNNYSETIMNALTFVDLEGKTIVEGIPQALQQVSGVTQEFAVTWYDGNPELTSTDATFPIIGKRYYNKTLLSIIEEWSHSEATGDGNYYWYVDNNNELRWFRGANTASKDFNTTTDSSLSLTPNVETDVKNFVILKGGYLPNGVQVQERYTDWSSYAKYGSKPYILVSENNTVAELTKLDIEKSFGNDQSTNKYPDLSSSFTTVWASKLPTGTDVTEGANTVTITQGSPVIINTGTQTGNEKMYNAVLAAEIKYRLKQEGKKYLEDRTKGKFTLDRATKAGTVDWGLGDRIQTTMLSKYIGQKELRVQSIQYTDAVDTFTLEEDTGSI